MTFFILHHPCLGLSDLPIRARLLEEACQWSVFSWKACFACFANGIYIWFMSATICRQANQKYKRKKNAKLSKPARLLEVWENPRKLWKKSPVFFSSNLLLCAMRLSGINGCETIVVKCYTLSAQPGAPDNYKRKRERGKKYRNDKNKLWPKRSWSCILWMALFL